MKSEFQIIHSLACLFKTKPVFGLEWRFEGFFSWFLWKRSVFMAKEPILRPSVFCDFFSCFGNSFTKTEHLFIIAEQLKPSFLPTFLRKHFFPGFFRPFLASSQKGRIRTVFESRRKKLLQAGRFELPKPLRHQPIGRLFRASSWRNRPLFDACNLLPNWL